MPRRDEGVEEEEGGGKEVLVDDEGRAPSLVGFDAVREVEEERREAPLGDHVALEERRERGVAQRFGEAGAKGLAGAAHEGGSPSQLDTHDSCEKERERKRAAGCR